MFSPRFTQAQPEIVSFEFLLERGHGLSCFRNLGFADMPDTVTVTVTSKLILVYYSSSGHWQPEHHASDRDDRLPSPSQAALWHCNPPVSIDPGPEGLAFIEVCPSPAISCGCDKPEGHHDGAVFCDPEVQILRLRPAGRPGSASEITGIMIMPDLHCHCQ
jgi:hypothetical protein